MIKFLRQVVRLSGFDVVRATTFDDGICEHLKAVIARHSIDTVLDVGANRGGYGKMLRRAGFKGRIYSFEPVSSAFAQLERAADGDDLWFTLRLALAEQAEEKEINVYANDIWSSFNEATAEARQKWTGLGSLTQEVVKVARLDEIMPTLPERDRCHRFLLKLDTQGYDVRAFMGARGALDDLVALQSEIAFIPLYNEMEDPYKVLHSYREAGFFITGMFPINRNDEMAIIEYDCVMVRQFGITHPWGNTRV